MKNHFYFTFASIGILFVITSFSLNLAGCVASKPEIVKITRLDPVSETDSKITKDGVTVEVTPVTNFNQASQYPELKTTVRKLDGNELVGVPGVVILPAFRIRITNNTGNAIPMADVAYSVNVNGKDCELYEYSALNMRLASMQPPQIEMMQTLSDLNYAGKSEKTKILPGKTGEFWATFKNFEVKEGTGPVTLQVYGIVTKTDAAGNVASRANFDFNFIEKTDVSTAK